MNVYYYGGEYLATDSVFDPLGDSPVSGDSVLAGTISQVPEPATWTMLIAGLFGVGAMLRGKSRRRLRFGRQLS